MPVILKNFATPNYISGIWEMSENSSELLEHCKLTDYDIEYLKKNNSEHRKIEILSIRALLNSLNINLKITYNNRKPVVNKGFISISHSKNLATIIWHPTDKTTIDIEKIREKILKVSEKVFSKEEIIMVNNNIEGLTKLWCAKEAVYKYFDYNEIDFKNQIHVTNINEKNNTVDTNLTVDNKRLELNLSFMKIEDYIIMWK